TPGDQLCDATSCPVASGSSNAGRADQEAVRPKSWKHPRKRQLAVLPQAHGFDSDVLEADGPELASDFAPREMVQGHAGRPAMVGHSEIARLAIAEQPPPAVSDEPTTPGSRIQVKPHVVHMK